MKAAPHPRGIAASAVRKRKAAAMPTTTKSRGNERSFGIYIHRFRRLESLAVASRPLQPQIIFYDATLTSVLSLQERGEGVAPGQSRAPLLICENLRNLWMNHGIREKHAALWR